MAYSPVVLCMYPGSPKDEPFWSFTQPSAYYSLAGSSCYRSLHAGARPQIIITRTEAATANLVQKRFTGVVQLL
jgi:hypothetical protein